MKYSDGTEAKIGDKIEFSDGSSGIVKCSIDANEYSEDHPKEQWAYLEKGIMVESEVMGVIHYEEPEPGMVLIERSK